MMKKMFSVFFVFLTFLSVFSCSTFASNDSWQASYFNKLVEIGEKPGFIRSLLTEKDANGFCSKTIYYALNDYNQDGIPELVVYGINSSNEAGDNYQIYTYVKGKIKKFKIINREGPYSENVSFSDQPYWPYYTNFFFLPDGYTDKKTNKLVWVMKTTPKANEFWAIAGTPYENETVFELDFDFQNMVVEIIPVVFAERTEPNEYQSGLKRWKENHELSILHDDYGRVIPNDYEELWNQFMEMSDSYLENTISASSIPKLETKNKFLVFRSKVIESEAFWTIGFYSLVIVFIVAMLLLINRIRKKISKYRI